MLEKDPVRRWFRSEGVRPKGIGLRAPNERAGQP
jgi:hypothetical protein